MLDVVKAHVAGERYLGVEEMVRVNEQMVTCAILATAWDADPDYCSRETLPEWRKRRDQLLGVEVAA
jgi:hypothetical protein